MLERGLGGCIVAVSSVQGRLAIPYRAACKSTVSLPNDLELLLLTVVCSDVFNIPPSCFPDGASKHALQAFFDSLRPEVTDLGIDILVISPGYIKTGMSLNALRGQGDKTHGSKWNGVRTVYLASNN